MQETVMNTLARLPIHFWTCFFFSLASRFFKSFSNWLCAVITTTSKLLSQNTFSNLSILHRSPHLPFLNCNFWALYNSVNSDLVIGWGGSLICKRRGYWQWERGFLDQDALDKHLLIISSQCSMVASKLNVDLENMSLNVSLHTKFTEWSWASHQLSA